MASPDLPIEVLVRGVSVSDRGSIARAINRVEDRRPERWEEIHTLLRALGPGRSDGVRVGLTGPPGAGKSTLVSAMVRALRTRGRTVAIAAVDPSSRRSGGALLGDRLRIETDPNDDGVFIRSIATAGELGGLARSVPAVARVLQCAFDWVLVETVGVGQSETEVEHVVDTVVYVLQPGSGDTVQFLKAGIMEIPDVFAVNKCDLGEPARRTAHELGAMARTLDRDGWTPPVLCVSAVRATRIDALLDAITNHRAHLVQSATLDARRLRGRVEWAYREFVRQRGALGVYDAGGEAALRRALEQAEIAASSG